MEYERAGSMLRHDVQGDGEPVLFVHGFPLSRELWAGVVPRLGPGWRAIAPDLRGHGESDVGPVTSMQTYAADLAALLDHLGESRPVVLVGLSMGGYVALELVRRQAERVRALVLANTRASRDSDEQADARRETARRVRAEGSGFVADDMARRLFHPEAPAELRTRWREIMAGTPPEGVAAALEAMAARPDSFDTLRAFDRPVLIVAGEADAITPVADAEAMQRAARNATLEVIEGAGHLTPVEQPERFAAVLRGFLGSLPATQPGGRDRS